MRKIIFATSNEDKMKEIRAILRDLPIEVVSLKDIDYHEEIEETGTTFEENAIIKARAIMEHTGEIVLADDSGLEVDYLEKAPGVYSARYMGNVSYEVKNNHIINLLKNAKESERSARFVCVIACALPEGEIITKRGTIEGRIGYSIEGENGFGYDPIFYVLEYQCTTAQMPQEQKNKISHRGKALQEMKKVIMQYISQ